MMRRAKIRAAKTFGTAEMRMLKWMHRKGRPDRRLLDSNKDYSREKGM